MLLSSIHKIVNKHHFMDLRDLLNWMKKLSNSGCVGKQVIHSRKFLWVYLKDYPEVTPKPKVKKLRKAQVGFMPVIPESEWLTWKGSLVNVPMVKEEPPTPTYKRSKEDIAKGIYRAEDRKGRWQVDSTISKSNHARGSSLSGNSFNVGV